MIRVGDVPAPADTPVQAPADARAEPPARPLRVLIVDDEPHARAGMARLLAGRVDCTVVGACGDGAGAVRAIAARAPDLVLLDVQMPEMSGFEVIRAVGPTRMPLVVFVTAYDAYALDAFAVHAVDYLLKPFSDRRFHEAVDRAAATCRDQQLGEAGRRLLALVGQALGAELAPPSTPPAGRFLSRFHVRGPRGTTLIDAADVDWIEGASYYARLHAGGRAHLLREALSVLELRLDPAAFLRVHRSAIVNVARVRELRRAAHGGHAVVLADGTRIRVSRSRWAAVSCAILR